MKKICYILTACILAVLMFTATTLAAQIIIPSPDETLEQPTTTPVIAAQQPAGGTAMQPSAAVPAQQEPAAVPAQESPAQEGPAQAAAATTFQTPDGVLSMQMPKGTPEWIVAQNPDAWFSISDGSDWIVVRHLSNGDPVPAAMIADDRYPEVFQVYYSTGNEVFIVTGYVTDRQKMPAVRDAVCSFKVLKYDTLLKKELPKEPQVREASEVQYCIQPGGVNVRANANTSSDILGGIEYGAQINITGYVVENGGDTGWLRISFNGRNAYVHGSNFSNTQPPERTGNTIDLYAPEGGGIVITVSEMTDGRYMDSNGIFYTKESDTEFIDDNGQKWVLPAYFEDNPVGQNLTDYTVAMINEETGVTVVVRGLVQGGYIDETTGVIYEQEGGGGDHMYGSDGSVLVFPDAYYDD